MLALFGIDGGALGLVINLLVLFLVIVYLALIYWTYLDARRRIEDPAVRYRRLRLPSSARSSTILRPPEFLEDREGAPARAAELRLRRLIEQSCPHCGARSPPTSLMSELRAAVRILPVPQAARPEVESARIARPRFGRPVSGEAASRGGRRPARQAQTASQRSSGTPSGDGPSRDRPSRDRPQRSAVGAQGRSQQRSSGQRSSGQRSQAALTADGRSPSPNRSR